MPHSTEIYKNRIAELEAQLAKSDATVKEQIKQIKANAKVANKAILKELKPLRRLVAPEKEKV